APSGSSGGTGYLFKLAPLQKNNNDQFQRRATDINSFKKDINSFKKDVDSDMTTRYLSDKYSSSNKRILLFIFSAMNQRVYNNVLKMNSSTSKFVQHYWNNNLQKKTNTFYMEKLDNSQKVIPINSQTPDTDGSDEDINARIVGETRDTKTTLPQITRTLNTVVQQPNSNNETKQHLHNSQFQSTKTVISGHNNSSTNVTHRYRKQPQIINRQLPPILQRTTTHINSVKSSDSTTRVKREDRIKDFHTQNHQNEVAKHIFNRTTIQPTPVHVYTINSIQTNATSLITPSNVNNELGNSTRDRMIKANLIQKATFKSKSPINDSESAYSRSMATTTVERSKTPNPFKVSEKLLLRLGYILHLTYPQLQKCLPKDMVRAQETFFKVEFYSTAVMLDKIHHQDPTLWQLLDDVDFNHYREDMLEYIVSIIEFDARERESVHNLTQTIPFDSLLSIISSRTNNSDWSHTKHTYDEFFRFISQLSSKSNPTLTYISRLDYICHIPLFLYVESLLDNAPPLFRFRENSILDLHMQRSKIINEHF
ncbi:unnamed protein product, partial [Didymodactylos carnosus]